MWHLGEVCSDPGRRATGGFSLGQPLWTGMVPRTVLQPVPSPIAANELLNILVLRLRTDRFADHEERFPVFTMRCKHPTRVGVGSGRAPNRSSLVQIHREASVGSGRWRS